MKIRPCIECPERALKIHELLFRERVNHFPKQIIIINELFICLGEGLVIVLLE